VKFTIDRSKIYLVVPSKRGGGSEAEVRGDGSASLGLHARGGRIVPLKKTQ